MFDGIFSMDSPFARFMAKIADFMILNIVFAMSIVPIVTIGASITAMYDVLTRMDTRKEVTAAAGFVKSFKSNLKQSTILWIIEVIVLAIIALDLYLVGNVLDFTVTTKVTLFIVFLILFFAVIMVFGYAFVLQARMENTVGKTIRLSAALTLVYLIPNSIFTGIINLLPVAILFMFTQLFFAVFPVWIFGGIPALAYVNSRIYMRILRKYVPEFNEDKKEAEYQPLKSLEQVEEELVEDEVNG